MESIALSTRLMTLSTPRIEMISNMPGVTVLPERATRMGWITSTIFFSYSLAIPSSNGLCAS